MLVFIFINDYPSDISNYAEYWCHIKILLNNPQQPLRTGKVIYPDKETFPFHQATPNTDCAQKPKHIYNM
ncbi:hypothetical protein AB204_01235 [Xenorhabdus khoisanae]|uniref:Uncharacterized protein n=1 Tax=Xenorhabdus khoisanae TaxID=880157 RepID=A0A0J5IUV9_9GAMM|nr:hypothetical protein AB204_01235 [Xenorhabdus khoisanae]